MSPQSEIAETLRELARVLRGPDVAEQVRRGQATFGVGTKRHEQAQLALLGQAAAQPPTLTQPPVAAVPPTTTPLAEVAPPTPATPELPPRPSSRPDPDATLAAIERLGAEVPGMLRSLDRLVDEAIRLDMADHNALHRDRPMKPAYPAEELKQIDAQFEARRRALLDMRTYALQVWTRRYAPFVQHPRTLHEQSRALTDAAASVVDLDEAYDAAERPKDSWTGADADAYRARVTPQRRAATEYAELVGSLADLVRQAATLHAGVYVVVHQVVQRAVNELRASNAAPSPTGEQARRMDTCRVVLEHLGTWLEVYATDGDWLANARTLGEQMERLTQQSASFPADRWPDATQAPAPATPPTPPTSPEPVTEPLPSA